MNARTIVQTAAQIINDEAELSFLFILILEKLKIGMIRWLFYINWTHIGSWTLKQKNKPNFFYIVMYTSENSEF